MQGRLTTALEGVYKVRNPVLWKVIECMHACKFVVSSKPRRHVEGPNPVYCVWTGKPITSEENVYACALTPFKSNMYEDNNIKPTMITDNQKKALKGEGEKERKEQTLYDLTLSQLAFTYTKITSTS